MERQELDPARQEQAKEYAGIQHRLLLVQLVLGTAFWLVFLFSGLSEKLADLWDVPLLAVVAAYVLIVMAVHGFMTAPLSYYGGFVLPHRYGLSHQSLKSWLVDVAKAGVLGLLLRLAFMVVVYWLLDSFPQTWWLLSAALAVLLMVVLTMLVPVVIIPIFFKLRPLEDSDLARRLSELVQRAGFKTQGISVINLSAKTGAGNAMLAGLGKTRRIILGDTILDQYTPDEIEVVTAHELGHHRHRHFIRLMAMQAALVVLGLYLTNLALGRAVPWLGLDGISDVAAFPVLVLTLGALSLLAGPVTNAHSRRLETAADDYALALTSAPDAFVDLMTKLTNQNLADATPPRWAEVLLHDHPPYWKRVARAEAGISADAHTETKSF
jgi:STE24 endopeptidase